MVISDKSSKFIVFKYNIYQTFTAMFTESKITEIYCLADDFCKEFTKQQEKYMLEDKVEGHKHRNKPNRMSLRHSNSGYAYSTRHHAGA